MRRIKTPWQNLDFVRRYPPINPTVPVILRIHVKQIDLRIEPVHVVPCERFKKTIIRQDPNILRKIGVINSAGAQSERLGCNQRSDPDRPRRADNQLSEFLTLNVIHHLQDRRKTQFLEFVFG